MAPSESRVIPRRAVISWILYDLANTTFSMGVVSVYFSLYVRDQVGTDRADATYGLITAVSMGLIFMLSPVLGAMTDRASRRMPFLIWSTLICCTATALFARGPFGLSVALFIVANAAYQSGLQFYDSLLPEVTTDENRGRISGIGVGVGYIGSFFAIGLGLLLPTAQRSLLFGAIALTFLVFALPCFFFVQERGNPHPTRIFSWQAVRGAAADTLQALRSGRRFPGLIRFLVARVFYTDAINTVITYMTLYTVNVAVAGGLSSADGQTQAARVMMSAIIFAVIGGILWGRLVDRVGPKRTLNLVLVLWMATFALAAVTGAFRLPVGTLYVVAIMAGVALGGVWSADRPYMLRLTPPSRIGEFYGLYGMVGRFSAVSGPLLWGAITYVAVQRLGFPAVTGQAMAITSLLAMVIVGFVILRKVTDEPRDWRSLENA